MEKIRGVGEGGKRERERKVDGKIGDIGENSNNITKPKIKVCISYVE